MKAKGPMATEVTFKIHGGTHTVFYEEGESLLETAIRHDLNPAYSCMEGVCAACIGRVLEGEVHFPDHTILNEAEVKKGLILTCQATVKPGCQKVLVDYESP